MSSDDDLRPVGRAVRRVPPGYVSASLHVTCLEAHSFSCVRCGALVMDVKRHDAWHEEGA